MSFYTDTIRNDPRATSVTAIRDLDLLEPATREAVSAIIADAAALGITLMVTETYRSTERQQHLFTTGATQLRAVGVHHYGLAADFCKLVDGKASWDGDWNFLGDLAKKYGMIWGGDWGEPDKPHTFRDMDHVQRCEVAQQNELFAGTWYPSDGADGVEA
jgi:hypothetical protein